MAKAVIVLEDGTSFEGRSFGAEGEKAGEVIFNTQIIGWQEMLTDPSYQDKIINIGYPHVGNYGVNPRCFESEITHALALIVKEYSRIYSNWQATGPLDEFMKKNGILGLEGIDTRALTIHIRDHGEMPGIISTKDFDREKLLAKIKEYSAGGSKPGLAIPQIKKRSQIKEPKTVIIDIGANLSTIAKYENALIAAYDTPAQKIIDTGAAEVVISSGPGDPRQLQALIEEVKKLIGSVRITGIQNGACVLALALGAEVHKMKVGHHGMNIPVVDPETGRGEISAQNHSFGLEKLGRGMEIEHINLNDKTIEKFSAKNGRCVGMLYFPIDKRGKLPAGYKLV